MAKKKSKGKKKSSKSESKKDHGGYFVKLENPKEIKKSLLKSSKLSIYNLKTFYTSLEKLKKKAEKKTGAMEDLLEDMTMLVNDLEKCVPKKALSEMDEMPEKKKRKKTKKKKKKKKKRPSKKEASELSKLKQSLSKIDKKLDKL